MRSFFLVQLINVCVYVSKSKFIIISRVWYVTMNEASRHAHSVSLLLMLTVCSFQRDKHFNTFILYSLSDISFLFTNGVNLLSSHFSASISVCFCFCLTFSLFLFFCVVIFSFIKINVTLRGDRSCYFYIASALLDGMG